MSLTINLFINQDNIKIIYNILVENNYSGLQDIYKGNDINSYNRKKEAIEFFNMYVNQFANTEAQTTEPLISLNKRFLQFLYAKKSLFPHKNEQQKQDNQTNKFNQIYDQPVMTNEDIRNERKIKFEKELEQKQNEFLEHNNKKIPEKINFSDKTIDAPIKDMDIMLNNIIKLRKYDIPPQPQREFKLIKIKDELIDNSQINNDIIDIFIPNEIIQEQQTQPQIQPQQPFLEINDENLNVNNDYTNNIEQDNLLPIINDTEISSSLSKRVVKWSDQNSQQYTKYPVILNNDITLFDLFNEILIIKDDIKKILEIINKE